MTAKTATERAQGHFDRAPGVFPKTSLCDDSAAALVAIKDHTRESYADILRRLLIAEAKRKKLQ